MSARAGRDGSTFVSHLIVNTRQVKNSKDVAVKTYCTIGDKKITRKTMVSVGGNFVTSPG